MSGASDRIEQILVQSRAEFSEGFPGAKKRDFVARAVNHHEALVKIVRELIGDDVGDDVGDMIAYGDAANRARALLAELDAAP